MAEAGARFQRVVRDAMSEVDLSLSGLAQATGIDRGRWYAWFKGVNAPRAASLQRAARVLRVEVDQLVEPWGSSVVGRPGSGGDADLSELYTRLDCQVDAINALVERLDSLASGAIRQGVKDALAEAVAARGDAGSPAATPDTPPTRKRPRSPR